MYDNVIMCMIVVTGSITPFWVEQKANIIVTLVEMIKFCLLQNVIRILHLVTLLHCCKCWTKVNFGQNLDSILSESKDKIMFGFCSTQYCHHVNSGIDLA